MNRLQSISICWFALVCTNVFGAPSLFYDETAFLSQTGPLTLESFEQLLATDPLPGSLAQIVTDAFTLTNSTGTLDFDVWDATIPNLAHPTHGNQFVVWYANLASTSVTFQFHQPINTLGVNIVNYGSLIDDSPLTFVTDGGDSGNAAFAPFPTGNDQFFGILGTTFTSITFARSHQNAAPIFDEIYFGNIPEPKSFVSALIAVVSCGVLPRPGRFPRATKRRN